MVGKAIPLAWLVARFAGCADRLKGVVCSLPPAANGINNMPPTAGGKKHKRRPLGKAVALPKAPTITYHRRKFHAVRC